jgi:hypothetical protein
MRFAHRKAQRRLVGRSEHEVYVVGHQAIGPHLHAAPGRLLSEQIAIDLLVAGLEEDRLAPDAPLGHMMREAGDDDASEAGHGGGFVPI